MFIYRNFTLDVYVNITVAIICKVREHSTCTALPNGRSDFQMGAIKAYFDWEGSVETNVPYYKWSKWRFLILMIFYDEKFEYLIRSSICVRRVEDGHFRSVCIHQCFTVARTIVALYL